MRRAVVRRHAQRQDRSDDQSHLSQAGVNAARHVGESSGDFDLVVTSRLPRAVETAIARGIARSGTQLPATVPLARMRARPQTMFSGGIGLPAR